MSDVTRVAVSGTTSTSGCWAVRAARACSLTSVTTTLAPSSSRCPARMRPTLPTPAMPDGPALEGGLAPQVLGGGALALEDAEGGEHGGVAGAAVGLGAAGGEAGRLADDVHVGDVGAHVAGGDVAAAEGLDEPAVGAQQVRGLVGRRVADDDGLAAAEVEAGHGVLVGHPPGEAQHVGQRRVLAVVGVEPRTAQGRPERRAVDPDDGPQAGLRSWQKTTCSCWDIEVRGRRGSGHGGDSLGSERRGAGGVGADRAPVPRVIPLTVWSCD